MFITHGASLVRFARGSSAKTKRIPDTVIYDNVCSTDTSSKAELFKSDLL